MCEIILIVNIKRYWHYFTNVELLRKIHNQLAYKDLGNNEFLEGLEYIETDSGTSVYRLMTGS